MAASAWTPVDETASAWKPVAESAPAQPSAMQVLTQPTAKTDKEYLGYTGPAGVVAATVHGLNDVAQGTKDAIKGAYDSVAQPPQDKTETAVSALGPAALPVYRMLRGLGHTAADATHLAAAIHDINQSPDPLGSYAEAAEKTAAQGAGQALVALGTEGAAKAAPGIIRGVKSAATPEVVTAPVRLGARAAETAINQKLVPVRSLANIMKPADAAEATQFKVPGRDFGLKPQAKAPTPELDATGENKPFAGGMDEAAPAKPVAQTQTPTAAPPAPTPSTSPAALKQQLNNALGVEPVNIKPGVSMRNQAAAQGAKLPDGFTPVESSALKGYKYDPDTQEFDAITNTGQRFRHGEVSPDQFKAFEDADSKGKAWNDLRNGAGVTPLGKVNADGVLQPRIKPRSVVTDPETGAMEFSDVLDAKQNAAQATPTEAPKAKAAAASAGSSDEDLTSLLQQSLDQVKTQKGGVSTTAAPADLAKRWGVDESSIADTDANVRGLNAQQSQAYINKLADAYKQGRPVEPVIETRDANNNITSVDGRHRALAAKKAGIERIPVIVRRISVQ